MSDQSLLGETTEGAAPLAGHRVLLVTDRPFLEPTDGSTHTYLMWLRVLNELGCRVGVLSFNRRSRRWSASDLARLPSLATSSLILTAHDSHLERFLDGAVTTAWRSFAGRRYLPERLETALRGRHRAQLGAFLDQGRFQSVVLNKLHTTALIGHALIRALPARKILDIHDNYPMRESFNRKVLVQLARVDRRTFRAVVKPKDMLEMASWAGQRRKLAEEVARLSDFDRVVFNAREEADIYVKAGLPRVKVAMLPVPRPADHAAPSDPAMRPRPYQVGLIGSAALSNIEGLHFLMAKIMPTLRQRGVRLLVAGTLGRFAKQFMTPEDGAVLGWIDDVSTFYDQVDVVLVPLLTGTGVSIKTIEAAAHGAAIVTTTVGMRGLDLQPDQDLLVADDGDAFTAAILQVLGDPALKTRLRRNALAGLRQHHSRAAFARGVVSLLQPP